MAHPAAILVCCLQEHVQKCPSLLWTLFVAVRFGVGNILCSFTDNLRHDKGKDRVSSSVPTGLKAPGTTDVNTHTVGKGVEDLKCPVVLWAVAKVVVHKVGPKPGCPLSAAYDVAHSVDENIKEKAENMTQSIICDFTILSLTYLYTLVTYSESELL